MSTARHHAEWLSLIETSGPFLSLPVLLEAFPQGLDAVDAEQAAELRAAYEEWLDNQLGLAPERAIHTAWVQYVLTTLLGMDDDLLARGQTIPEGLKAVVAEHHETLRPDMVLRDLVDGTPRLLIRVLPQEQDLEKSLPDRGWAASPTTRMMELLRATGVRLGLVTNGEHWMLVQAQPGETTGYANWYANLWVEERLTLRAFVSLLHVARFFGVPDDQTLPALLDRSAKDQQEVTDQLGYQVRRAVEILVQSIDRADQDRGGALLFKVDEATLYEAALTVMMRLVFLLSAEERGLLLLGEPLYDQYYAVSTLRVQLRELADQVGEEVLERRFDAWSRLLATFRAVYGGIQHEDLLLPAYGGSLFDPDRFPFLEGRRGLTQRSEGGQAAQKAGEAEAGERWRRELADPLPISNRTVLHLLDALQLLQMKVPGGGPAEARRLSFRALDIEQIGHVYEGLLDHQAARATEPVLGLTGTSSKEPEVPLSALEQFGGQAGGLDEAALDNLLAFLKDETGRSESALRRALLETEPAPLRAGRLRVACGNDAALLARVRPWAGLVRDDDFGYPVVIRTGSVYVTSGTTRRATGTHYTPRSLTEPIVQHTLEPLVYVGPAEGKPKAEWELRGPAELLALKVCDMAMGSGAFLVQACRYLSERLVEAWEAVPAQRRDDAAETGRGKALAITPEGKPATGAAGETLIPEDGEERLLLARRLVADRCLYGVDKNRLAVEMAKLSLWLITMGKGRPFTFLDHALKHGDSLIGADEEMFLRWAHGLRDSSMPLFDQEIRRLVAEAKTKRQALQAFEVRDVRDAAEKARLNREADAALARIKLGCDLLVGARLLDDLSQSEQDALLANGLLDYVAGRDWQDPNAARAVQAAQALPVFHWPFEFPEVFADGGFSAFAGNPPFIGGRRIRDNLGDYYREALYQLYSGSSGNADYCAYFFLKGFENLRTKGALGLIATNTIGQGDTKETGLDKIIEQGGTIFNATVDKQWPGQASVFVNIVNISKGTINPPFSLDSKEVNHISSFLDDRIILGDPHKLAANEGKSHMGSNVVGMGFVLTSEEAQELLAQNKSNTDVLFPFMNGQDLNSSPSQSASRWVINFGNWPLARAEKYQDCMKVVRERVYPDRITKKGNYAEKWWQFGRRQDKLYEAIEPLARALAIAQTSQTAAIAFVPKGIVFSHKVIIFAFDDYYHFAILQSSFHESWARRYSSTLKQDLSYTPSSAFQTFAMPQQIPDSKLEVKLIGENYHDHRQQIMTVQQEGLTSTYNHFHDPNQTAQDIARLRQLHMEMDNAVAAAYGWSDLDLGHGFHETPQGMRFTISEAARRTVLTRLLKLNHQRYEEEVAAGLHGKQGRKETKEKQKQSKRKPGNDAQLSLF